MEQEAIEALFGGLALGTILVFLITLAAIIFLGIYVYFSMAWMNIAQKLKYKKAWLAWIPFANIAMIFQLAGIHWAWIFLFLIPVFGWIALFGMTIVATWTIFEKRKFPGWLSLFQFIPLVYLVIIGFVAWYKQNKK
jgi:TctA family transporter